MGPGHSSSARLKGSTSDPCGLSTSRWNRMGNVDAIKPVLSPRVQFDYGVWAKPDKSVCRGPWYLPTLLFNCGGRRHWGGVPSSTLMASCKSTTSPSRRFWNPRQGMSLTQMHLLPKESEKATSPMSSSNLASPTASLIRWTERTFFITWVDDGALASNELWQSDWQSPGRPCQQVQDPIKPTGALLRKNHPQGQRAESDHVSLPNYIKQIMEHSTWPSLLPENLPGGTRCSTHHADRSKSNGHSLFL